jgi:hypothetical protein
MGEIEVKAAKGAVHWLERYRAAVLIDHGALPPPLAKRSS